MTHQVNNAKCAQQMLANMKDIHFPNVRKGIYEQPWLNVEDYLPPFHKHILLYMPNVENTQPINVGYLETDGNFYFNEIPENIDALAIELVTHWMHLPEPPK